MMRRVLVDHARSRHALKRDVRHRVTLDENVAVVSAASGFDLLGLDEALEELAAAEPRWAQVVELRFFAGLEIPEAAAVLNISPATVKRDWQFAKGWLAQRLGSPDVA
jgi:RNA polymerase sigma factor (TIGR02999 family)